MFEKLWNAQPIASKRRIHFTYRDATTGDNVDPGDLTGIKAKIRLDGSGALVTSTNDVAKLDQTDHLGAGYVEFTAAEFTAFVSGELIVSVSGIAGVKVEDAQATLFTFDPNDPGATTAQIASQMRTELSPELGDIVALNSRVPSDPADASDVATATNALAGALAALNDVSAADILNAVIETNGATTITVLQALQIAAAVPTGEIAGVVAGVGTKSFTIKSASGQDFLTYTGDELGNRTVAMAALTQ